VVRLLAPNGVPSPRVACRCRRRHRFANVSLSISFVCVRARVSRGVSVVGVCAVDAAVDCRWPQPPPHRQLQPVVHPPRLPRRRHCRCICGGGCGAVAAAHRRERRDRVGNTQPSRCGASRARCVGQRASAAHAAAGVAWCLARRCEHAVQRRTSLRRGDARLCALLRQARVCLSGSVACVGAGGQITRAQLGRSTWTFLHKVAAKFPEQPTEEERARVGRSLLVVMVVGTPHFTHGRVVSCRRCCCSSTRSRSYILAKNAASIFGEERCSRFLPLSLARLELLKVCSGLLHCCV
jgi:hypothetical protein